MAFTIDDNPFLDPSFVASLKREYAGTVYYDRFILGKWKAAEGLIYQQFADNPDMYLTDMPAEPDARTAWLRSDVYKRQIPDKGPGKALAKC